MIDIALLRTDPDLVRCTVKQHNADVDVAQLVEVDAELRQAIARSDQLRTRQKRQDKSREQVGIDGHSGTEGVLVSVEAHQHCQDRSVRSRTLER